jgi:hypothetical protein
MGRQQLNIYWELPNATTGGVYTDVKPRHHPGAGPTEPTVSAGAGQGREQGRAGSQVCRESGLAARRRTLDHDRAATAGQETQAR